MPIAKWPGFGTKSGERGHRGPLVTPERNARTELM
jgi:hypothetical protein